MKTVTKEVKLKLMEVSISLDRDNNFFSEYAQELRFGTNEPVHTAKLSHYVEIEIPETIKEFRELHNISKEDLVEWLNENYKL